MTACTTLDDDIDALFRLDPEKCVDRDTTIREMVRTCGWPPRRIGGFFGITAARVRQIAGPEALRAAPRGPAGLSADEAKAMLNDYRLDPYTSPAERRAARAWIESQVGPIAATPRAAAVA